jgi:hypothetical protein
MTTEVVIQSDSRKAKVGQQGSLVLAVAPSRTERAKAAKTPRRTIQSLVLPAIPFEIVGK